MGRPDLSRVPDWYHGYVNLVSENDLLIALKDQTASIQAFFNKIPSGKHHFRYAEGKWSIKEVLQHIIDAERVFAYRALCFARKEAAALPSFDENEYASNSKADVRDWRDLLAEFKAVRHSTEILFSSFDEEQMQSNGIANGNSVYVAAIGFIVVGHAEHHRKGLEERYLHVQ